MKIIRYLIHHLFHFFFRLIANGTIQPAGPSGLRLHCIKNLFAFVSCDDHQIALNWVYWWWLICITIGSCHWLWHQSKLNKKMKMKMKKKKWMKKKSIDVAFDPLKLFIIIHCFDYSQQFDTISSIISAWFDWQFNFVIMFHWINHLKHLRSSISNLHTTFSVQPFR